MNTDQLLISICVNLCLSVVACADFVPRRERLLFFEESHASAKKTTLIYRGPFAEIKDDHGHTWHCGEPQSIPIARWQELRNAGLENMFTEIPETLVPGQCGP